MTNEEAIKHVENMKKGIFLFYPDELYDTIINALKKEPELKTIINTVYGRPDTTKYTSDILTVSFDNSLMDKPGLCVTRKCGEKTIVLKMELGEQADILYHLLTEQMTKAEIKAESEVKVLTNEEAIDILQESLLSDEEIRDLMDDEEEIEKTKRYVSAIKVAIKALEQEPKWIPVSEKLPGKDGRYLATILNKYDNRLRYIMTCEYFAYGRWYPDDESASNNVIAWMPLPEPYKVESEEQ